MCTSSEEVDEDRKLSGSTFLFDITIVCVRIFLTFMRSIFIHVVNSSVARVRNI